MISYDAVTLERGISYDDDFNRWMKSVTDGLQEGGDPLPRSGFTENGSESYRTNVVIRLHDKAGNAVKQYTLKNAWPSEYTIGDFDATSNDVVVSSLVLQHHGIEEVSLVK
jgi:phage tail-like protein